MCSVFCFLALFLPSHPAMRIACLAGDFVRVIAWLLHAAPSHKHLVSAGQFIYQVVQLIYRCGTDISSQPGQVGSTRAWYKGRNTRLHDLIEL